MITQFTAKKDFVGVRFENGQVAVVQKFQQSSIYLTGRKNLPDDELIGAEIEIDPGKYNWGYTGEEMEFNFFIPVEKGQLAPPQDDFEILWISSMVDLAQATTTSSIPLIDPQGVEWVVSPTTHGFRFESDTQELAMKGTLEQILKKWKQEPAPIPKPAPQVRGVIETTHWPSWKVKDWMYGQGFEFDPDLPNDEGRTVAFVSPKPVEEIYSGWTPSLDGSRLSSYSQLSDPNSPHIGRHYIVAFKYTGRRGHPSVMVWHTNSSNSVELFAPIGHSSLADWEKFAKAGTYAAWQHWRRYNGLLLDGIPHIQLEEDATEEDEAKNAQNYEQFLADTLYSPSSGE